jgi:flagellar protein FlgJ
MTDIMTNLPAASILTAPKIPTTGRNSDAARLKKATEDFEAIFIQSMFKSMRKTIPESGFIEKSAGHDIYRDMMDAEIAKEISRRQSMGLAAQMYRQMEKFLPPDGEK